eukprot:11320348-Alexandrium_andersonii.AAC.1
MAKASPKREHGAAAPTPRTPWPVVNCWTRLPPGQSRKAPAKDPACPYGVDGPAACEPRSGEGPR